jgi:heme exporter protein B
MTFWRQVVVILQRDLVVERRASEALTVVMPFGVVALMAVPLAVGLDLPVISRIGPPVFWATALLFGMQVALRHSAADTAPQRDLLALLGVDPAARLVGRSLSAGTLLATYLAITAAAMVLFYSPELTPGWPNLIPVGLLFAAGLAILATLSGEITAGLRSRSSLAPLLVAPLSIPLLVGASQAQESLTRGDGILIWTLLLVAVDLTLGITTVLVARPLEEATR